MFKYENIVSDKNQIIKAYHAIVVDDLEKESEYLLSLAQRNESPSEVISYVYRSLGLIFEPIINNVEDYYLDEAELKFIAHLNNDSVVAVINGTIFSSEPKSNLNDIKGVWVLPQQYQELMKILYPNNFYEDEEQDVGNLFSSSEEKYHVK